MTVGSLRAVATALLLGTAALSGGAILSSSPAAAAMRAAVGKPLQEAISLYNAKNYKAAMAKVNEAEAVSNKTAEESRGIEQMKNAIAIASGDPSTPAGAEAKFANDYNAGRFKEVISEGEMLRKVGRLDGKHQQLIAQAYYRSGDKAGCVRYIKNTFGANPSDSVLELQMRCAYDIGDDETQRAALETLVAHTQKAEYWASLLKLSEHAQGMRDPDTLDIYRLKMLTGNVNTKDEYNTLAQLAIQLKFYAEAQSALEKGQAAKVLNDERTTKLLALAKSQAAADAANQGKDLAAANAAPKGDALVHIGQDQWGQGKAKEAVATIQAGMKKPLADKNGAAIHLGMVQIAAGQKADAIKTLATVQGPKGDKSVMLAHLWSLYAKK